MQHVIRNTSRIDFSHFYKNVYDIEALLQKSVSNWLLHNYFLVFNKACIKFIYII